jgi:hypothetical protein
MSYNPANVAKSVLWRAVFALRETGQALERVGCRLQGIYSHEEISESCPDRGLLEPFWLSTVMPHCATPAQPCTTTSCCSKPPCAARVLWV